MEIKGIIYDFDGVICDSVDVKTQAFAMLYEPYGKDIQEMVVKYHLRHGGISRYEKIRYYHRELLGKELTPSEIAELADQFAGMVKKKVISAAYIPGSYEFVRYHSEYFPQFICTGTPEIEILEILQERGINSFFQGIYGSPKSKATIIHEILELTHYESTEMIYFGDALTDYYAAKEFNMPFVGIMNAATVFPSGVPTIPNFDGLLLKEIKL